eukprot:TRINITY_DN31447_c0_g1_i1.p1 TRINITY_DN31447_c0_g1~~TRINITY_DN31447_c0_g1_i1.p1  ORF type:complete len:152 (+),score=56.27 TRINITY_DN31447_c0_g1_i1:66-521(+)
MVLFKRLVEIGRVALINYGPDQGKLAVIIDVIDQNRALVDGPSDVTGVPRQAIQIKWLSLTKFKIAVPRAARLKTLRKVFEKEGVQKKFEATTWAKKLAARAKRASLSDFDRFKVLLAKKRRSGVMRAAVNKLKKEHNVNAQKAKKFTEVL